MNQSVAEDKVPISEVARFSRIILDSGTVAEVTGHKTKFHHQVKIIESGDLRWISCLAKVHLAR